MKFATYKPAQWVCADAVGRHRAAACNGPCKEALQPFMNDTLEVSEYNRIKSRPRLGGPDHGGTLTACGARRTGLNGMVLRSQRTTP